MENIEASFATEPSGGGSVTWKRLWGLRLPRAFAILKWWRVETRGQRRYLISSSTRKIFTFYSSDLINISQKGNPTEILIGWYLNLNTDGTARGSPGLAWAGRFIRDRHGNLIAGFQRKIQLATNMPAELLGLKEGLKLVKSLNIRQLEIELDALTIIQLIQSADTRFHVWGTIFCLLLLKLLL
ncbi:hypothetical protein ACH5RR_012537 [Cinchona calisaya]|uniref:RNase H type-1 domain-containing protein n=1 Tax=Cinchona calisaya TaxID=153742 RepID=A0ABD3A7X9_9GENT